MIGAGLDVVLLVEERHPEVEPARGLGVCDGASHYGGLGGDSGCDGASHHGGPGDNYSPCWSLPNSVWEHFFLF